MNAVSKRRVALKGQSRSKFCAEPIRARSKTLCARLAGHSGKHRATTTRGGSATVAAKVAEPVQPTEAPVPVPTATPSPSTVVIGQWTVEGYEVTAYADGTVRSVKIVPMEAPKARAQGRTRGARRGKKFHASTRPSARLA